jgi:serine protease AprX
MKIPIFGFTATRRAISIALLASFVFTNAFAVDALRRDTKLSVPVSAATANYTTDLTELGRNGSLRQDLRFDAETAQLIKMLAEGGVRQPVIIDQDKDVLNTVVEQAALRIAKGNVPAGLKDREIIKIDVANLFSNARDKASAAKTIAAVVDDAIASNGRMILFVDELTSFVGSDAASTKMLDAIKDGKLVIVGGSSPAAYDERIDSKAEIAGYFNVIRVAAKNSNGDVADNDGEGYRGDNVSPDLRDMMAKDPSGKKRVNVILQAKDADNAAFRAMLASGDARIGSRIGTSDTLVANMSLSGIQSLSQSGMINYVSPDRLTQRTGHIENTTGVTQVRNQAANGLRPAYTLDGDGVGIAVLDSGLYTGHNGFKTAYGTSRVVANVNFTDTASANDVFGHGTHVAGLAAGSLNSTYEGMAPDAKIIGVKVLNNSGQGQASWLLAGMNWVLQNRTTYNIKVVNLSLGMNAIDTYTNDPLCLKAKELVAAGIVVVAASGNLGKDANGTSMYGRIHSPGNSPYVITVGATNTFGTLRRNDDVVTSYSSSGPTRSFYTQT